MYKGTLSKVLFLDIETTPQQPSYSLLDDTFKALWDHKAKFLIRDVATETPESIYERAGIYAEFGKIVCISCGFISPSGSLKIKSFSGNQEEILLKEFSSLLTLHFNTPEHALCAHNGKEFDFPYLCRRMIINDLPIPSILNITGKKPWETSFLDTMEMWRFGDYKSFTSLNLLAQILGIPSPKDDIDGSQVWRVYWIEKDLERIVRYCQKDVVTLTKIFLRLNQLPGIDDIKLEMV
ncbi:MAG: 3'-5' exonuclease [Bacteroidetes bacterium]|nr:3'-5' exonuclease [Bacteroidota bacterium]